MSLPVLTPSTVQVILITLLEPSPALNNVLVPAVQARPLPKSYTALIDECAAIVDTWDYDAKANFVGGHPAIGEVGNLSALSAKEQLSRATRPVVLDRLAHLNKLYCQCYPDLSFVTFVNGRPRSEIVNEMERSIGIPVSPDPLPDNFPVNEPALNSPEVKPLVRERLSKPWRDECERAIADVWTIARARIRGLGLE